MKPRVILADDHPLILEGLTRVLAADYVIVATARNGRDLLDLAVALKPEIAILDIVMPVMNGIEAARKIGAAVPETKIVFVTQMENQEYVRSAFEAGAYAFILKQSVAADLLTGLSEVLRNREFVSPELRQPVLPRETSAAGLTPRQREVLRLLAKGLVAKEIATALSISPRTVEFHKAALLQGLGVRTTAELIRYAVLNGIID